MLTLILTQHNDNWLQQQLKELELKVKAFMADIQFLFT